MTLTKNKMVREIGRRTRLKNRDVQSMIETLIEVWTETLIAGERIELEDLFVLQAETVDRGEHTGFLSNGNTRLKAPRHIRRLIMRVSKSLKRKLNS